MIKNKIASILPQIIIVIVILLLYIATDFFCIGNCPYFVFSRIDPLYTTLLFFLPTAIWLFFFPWKLFVSWTKHVAWWFSIFTMWAVTNFGGGGFLNPSRNDVAIFCMAILFIITFVYTLVMKKKIANNP